MQIHTFVVTIGLLVSGFAPRAEAQTKWERVPLPPPYDNTRYLDIFFLPSNAQYGWISGHNGLVLRTTDGGMTWRGSTTPVTAQLEDIVFVSEQVGFCSGMAKQEEPYSTGGVFKTTDGGATWADITPTTINNGQTMRFPVFGCHFTTEREGVAVGGGCGAPQLFYRTHDGGKSWIIAWAQEPMSGVSHAIPSADGDWYASSSGYVWKSNDGVQWSKFATTGEKYWQEGFAQQGNTFLTATSGMECHGGAVERGDIRISNDGGKTWNTTPVPQQMFGTFLLNEQEGWSCGRNAALYYTPDAGATWVTRNSGIPATAHLDNVFFVDKQHGFVVGDGIYRTGYATISQYDNETFAQIASLQVTPQPVTKQADVRFTLPDAQFCTVTVTDMIGRTISTIHNGVLQAGAHTLQLDGASIPDGSYFVTLKAGDNIMTYKITVIK